MPIKCVFRKNKVTHLIHDWLQLRRQVRVIRRDFERIEETVVLLESLGLSFYILCFKETFERIAKLIAHIEVHYLSIGLWIQRVTVMFRGSTITARTEQTINQNAVLVNANAAIGVSQPTTSEVANSTAL